MTTELAAGDEAPAFELPVDGGGVVSLRQFRGRKLVLYFYPKDDTPGCTVEAIAFNGLRAAFKAAGADLLGVSADSVASHDKFKKKYDLAFALASDEKTDMLKAYGVWKRKSMFGNLFMGVVRTTMLIDETGKIARIWNKVSVDGHAEEVLEAVKSAA